MLFSKVREVILSNLHCTEADVTPEARLTEDLGADSLDALELIMELERVFEVDICDEDTEGIKTVGELVAALEARL